MLWRPNVNLPPANLSIAEEAGPSDDVSMTVATPAASDAQVIQQVRGLFSTRRPRFEPGLVGVELEFIPVRADIQPPQPVGKLALENAMRSDPDLAREACISFEPGGQIELSPLPSASVTELLTTVDRLVGRLRQCAALHQISLVSTGTNMWHSGHELGLQTDRPRYRAMQAHFDAIGPYGRQMMRQTAAVHICFDFGEPEVQRSRWLLANLAGPALTAAFANSAVLDGVATGLRSTRSAIWQNVDASRTAFDGEHIGPDPVEAYTSFALAAEAMALPRHHGEPLPFRMRFGDWWSQGNLRPDDKDLTHHLTTLFPPVRPHMHMEVRYIDALPQHWIPIPVLILTALLYDKEACEEALAGLSHFSGSLRDRWQDATLGMTEPALRDEARMLFDLALSAFERFPSGYFPTDAAQRITDYRDRYIVPGRCPADDQLNSFVSSPDDPSAFL
jgi:glutamate--cysteine ligase